MKKIKLLSTVNYAALKKALEKDIDLIWEHASYNSFDYEETLKTLYYCGLEALPNLKYELKKSREVEFKRPLSFLEKLKYILWILQN